MITDKLVGPKVRIMLSKFLPVIFMDAMKDSPETSLHMFDSEWGWGSERGWGSTAVVWEADVTAMSPLCPAAPADTQENPELIWNDESREKVCDTVKRLADRSVLLTPRLTSPCPTPCPTPSMFPHTDSCRFYLEQSREPASVWQVSGHV